MSWSSSFIGENFLHITDLATQAIDFRIDDTVLVGRRSLVWYESGTPDVI